MIIHIQYFVVRCMHYVEGYRGRDIERDRRKSLHQQAQIQWDNSNRAIHLMALLVDYPSIRPYPHTIG